MLFTYTTFTSLTSYDSYFQFALHAWQEDVLQIGLSLVSNSLRLSESVSCHVSNSSRHVKYERSRKMDKVYEDKDSIFFHISLGIASGKVVVKRKRTN